MDVVSSGQDRIIIRKLKLKARLGWTEKERVTPQKVRLTLELGIDAQKAARSKKLADTVCYSTLSNRLQEFISSNSWGLLEAMSEDISDFIFEEFDQVKLLTLTLEKFVLPNAKSVAVQITRKRH